MRAFVLHAHPCSDSFAGALHCAVTQTLATRGWEVDDCNLYAEGFDPVLSASERRGYHDMSVNTAPVATYVERLRAARALVLVFPVWNFGYPAILKGFFDRVFLPGVSFVMRSGQVAPGLTHIERVAAVTTYGATRLRTILAGDLPRRVVTRPLRFVTRPGKLRYLALYDMNRADDARRQRFMARVRREMAVL